NKVKQLHGANIAEHDLDNYVEGKPVGTIKGYRVEKIFESQDEIDGLNAASSTGLYDRAGASVGDYKFKDSDGDGRITTDDRTVIGTPEADYFGGFNTTLQYKNFSLGAYFQYSVGGGALWTNMSGQVSNQLLQNKLTKYVNDIWTPDNPEGQYAKPVYGDPAGNARISDRYIFSTSYLRLSSLQVAYTFEPRLMQKMGLANARIFVSGTNLFTLTKWPGTDPGASSSNTNITFQTENTDPYPLARSFSLGLEVK